MEAEGWYVDPYRRHKARWFSNGTSTDLVSDGGAESSDPPPDAPFTGSLEPIDRVRRHGTTLRIGTRMTGRDATTRASKQSGMSSSNQKATDRSRDRPWSP